LEEFKGVCYRACGAEKAQELDLVGWVRNNRDGTVEVEAQGLCDNLKLFVECFKQGPDISKVTNVDENGYRETRLYEFSCEKNSLS